jgi:hypothetical protein
MSGGLQFVLITDELRSRIVQEAPPEFLPMIEANGETGRFAGDRDAACKARPVESCPGTA